jgi:hypothetical protein
MTRRLAVLALLLLTISPAAMAANARRRAVTPGTRTTCTFGTVLPATYANVLAADDQYVYLIDEFTTLARVPKLGGEREDLADPLDDWLPLAREVDDTTIYISALPLESFLTPLPGVILAVPKNGGVITVLASGVETALMLALDDTHIYWPAAGILDFDSGELTTSGKIERIRKDGTNRQVLAADLSAPLSLALDGNDVYFGQTGLAEGDPTVGVYRVAKNGGAVATIDADVLALGVTVAGNKLLVFGATENTDLSLLVYDDKSGATTPRVLLTDEATSSTIRVADGRAYVMLERETTELWSVNIDSGAATQVRGDLDGDVFLIDGCAAIVNTTDGDIIRTQR